MSKRVDKEYYTISEVATILGFSPSTIRRAIEDNRITAIKVLGNIRIHRDELDRLTSEKQA